MSSQEDMNMHEPQPQIRSLNHRDANELRPRRISDQPAYKYAIIYQKKISGEIYEVIEYFNSEQDMLTYAFNSEQDMLTYAMKNKHNDLRLIRYQEYELETKLILKLK